MFILGDILSTRLREVLREDLGGVYGVGAGGRLSRSPRQERVFSIQFGCDPSRVDELLAAVRKEIAAISKDGIGADYVDKTKQKWLRQREVSMRQNGFWADWLESAYRFGDDPTLVLDPAPVLARMTPEHVKAAARKYLDGKQQFQAVMLPETTPAAAGAVKAP